MRIKHKGKATMEKKQVIVWISRHDMTLEQEAYWKKIEPNVEIVTENITWANSENEEADYYANVDIWNRLIDKYDPICFTGVFPTVALESINHCIQMFQPISKQVASERADGTKKIDFVHLRWSSNINRNIKTKYTR